MRTLSRLTALHVKRAHRPGAYSDGGGLYLQITRNRAKSWLFHTVSLADARVQAFDCRRLLIDGVDLLVSRVICVAKRPSS